MMMISISYRQFVLFFFLFLLGPIPIKATFIGRLSKRVCMAWYKVPPRFSSKIGYEEKKSFVFSSYRTTAFLLPMSLGFSFAVSFKPNKDLLSPKKNTKKQDNIIELKKQLSTAKGLKQRFQYGIDLLEAYEKEEKIKEQIELLKSLIVWSEELYGDASMIRFYLANCYKKCNEMEKAYEVYLQIAQDDAFFSAGQESKDKLFIQMQLYKSLGQVCFVLKKYEEASEWGKKVVLLAKECKGLPPYLLAEEYGFFAAYCFYCGKESKSFEKAEFYWKKALKILLKEYMRSTPETKKRLESSMIILLKNLTKYYMEGEGCQEEDARKKVKELIQAYQKE